VKNDDNLTFWLKMFLAFWIGCMIGMGLVGWFLGREFTTEYVAWRALAATGIAAVLATLRLFGR
jgi:uncharacterized protein (DUF983 family)